MARTTLIGPPNNSAEFNTGDSAERGMHPKELIDAINTMTSELYAGSKMGRPVNSIYWIGTSRHAAQYLDVQAQRNKSNAGYMNWMANLLKAQGKPLFTLGNSAVSGTRTDQFNVAAALASNAAIIGMDGFVNDIAQNYPTATTSGATGVANLKAYIKAFNLNGQIVFYPRERGAQNYTTAQQIQLNDANRAMDEFLAFGDDSVPGLPGPPAVISFDASSVELVTSSNGTIALTNTVDGTHDNVAGAIARGTLGAAVLGPYLRQLPGYRLRSLNEKSSQGTREIIQTSGLTGSVAVANAGNTGNLPTNCASNACTGGVTAAYSIQATTADANGDTWGNEIKVVATAASAGTCKFTIALDKTLFTVGDIIRAGYELDITGASALQGASALLECFPSTGGPAPTFDMIESTVGLDPGGYTGLCMEPPAMLLTPYTGTPFTNIAFRMTFNGAGGATAVIRKPWGFRATR